MIRMQITIKTPSRLHLGFLDLSGDLGRLYGSIGVALENPSTIIEVEEYDNLFIENENGKRILDFVKRFSEYYKTEVNVRIRIRREIPEHVGLGSGTQLALAISVSLARIYNINANTRELSRIMGRGTVSGIGTACFESGGFIIDSGHKYRYDYELPPNVIFRYDFPEDWCFIIVIPKTEKGFSGEREREALKGINPSKRISEEICRLVQIKLLPSLIERDIEEFGDALTEIDKRTGIYFKNAQGGIYRESIGGGLIKYMLQSGAYGAGQSSWGPAVYALTHKKNSSALLKSMNEFLIENDKLGNVFISHCNNKGAEIDIRDKNPIQ